MRVIVYEQGTWQKSIALFLQEKLKILKIDDPFMVRSSDGVGEFLKENSNKGFLACSVDVKDLYYSLPHDKLLKCVEECIDNYGMIAFQNEAGMTIEDFLELLCFYLNSTFAEWNNDIFILKRGVCIGSCIAPILSDVLLAQYDRVLLTLYGFLDMLMIF